MYNNMISFLWTLNTRNTSQMLLSCKEKANQRTVPYTDSPLSPPIPKSRINARNHRNRFRTLACKRRTEETKLQGTQGPEEMCLSLEHQDPSTTSEKMGYFDRVTWSTYPLQFRYTSYRPQTKRLRARKIGLQCRVRKSSHAFYMDQSDKGENSSQSRHSGCYW